MSASGGATSREARSHDDVRGSRVLIVDDDAAFRYAMRKALRRLSFEVLEASSGEEALPLFTSDDPPEAALLDLRMKGMDGIEVLRRRGGSVTRVIVLTGHGSVEAAVEAMKLGAFSFLEKPVDAEVLGPLLRHAVEDGRRAREAGADDAPPLIGNSPAMTQVRRFIETVAPTDETVTVLGETGTGKEVVARHVHFSSRRRDAPFVAMNAACVPRELFESELFGHKRGAFTGATGDRLGVFREANGGTLFLDELAELPIDLQPKLLRALENKRVRPVGDNREHDVDVRIVAATNRDLWEQVHAGRFREDLYFRLQVFPVVIPPLRQRRDDILPLARHLLQRVGAPGVRLTAGADKALYNYDWPGNVRELLNVLRRGALFTDGNELDGELTRRMIAASVFGHSGLTSRRPGAVTLDEETQSLAEVERAHIERVLTKHEGNITKAAVALGIDRRTLQRKLRAYGFEAG